MITRDEVFKLAIAAGLEFSSIPQAGVLSLPDLERFAEMVDALVLEREAERASSVVQWVK
jgi:hypothetical protein